MNFSTDTKYYGIWSRLIELACLLFGIAFIVHNPVRVWIDDGAAIILFIGLVIAWVGLIAKRRERQAKHQSEEDGLVSGNLKVILVKYAKWCYAISASLWVAAILIFIHGGDDNIGYRIAIAGLALALVVADATGQLKPFGKRKD